MERCKDQNYVKLTTSLEWNSIKDQNYVKLRTRSYWNGMKIRTMLN